MAKRRASSSAVANGSIPPTSRGTKRKSPKTETTVQKKAIVYSCILAVISIIFYEFRDYLYFGTFNVVNDTAFKQSESQVKNSLKSQSGWRLADEETDHQYGSSICTIEKRLASDISQSEFESIYRFKKPVILTFSNGAYGWTDPTKWTVASLTKEYGQWSVLSGNAREIVRRGGSGYTDTSFTEYVDKLMSSEDTIGEPFYVFDRDFYNDSSLPSTIRPPSYLSIKNGIDDSIFFLGSSRSGVSFHKHADAWNGVVYGRKRWFLYPPEKTPPGGVYSGVTMTEWFQTVYPKLSVEDKPLECIQLPGEILYLPEGTYHGTINLGDTIAIGIQKKEAVTEVEQLFYEENKVMNYMRRAGKNQKLRQKYSNRKREILETILKISPGNTEINMKVGQMYREMNDLEMAKKYTKLAVKMDPYFVVAILNLAGIHAELGDLKQAESLYHRSMDLCPSLWDNYAQYGDFLLNSGRPEDAVAVYKKGTELEPKTVEFWRHLQIAQQRSGDSEGARHTQEVITKLLAA